jgi:hypothetical protein
MDGSQSTRLALDRFTADDQPSSREEAMAANHPAPLGPPRAATPPPPLISAPDLTSKAPKRQQEDAGSASAATLAEPAAATATTTLPPLLLDQRTAVAATGSLPPIQDGVARAVALGSQEGLLPLARALRALGYNEMAASATLHPNLPSLARWHGPITVFAALDVSLQTSCPFCSRRRVLLEHIALGYYPYSELAASPTTKIPSASLNLCLNVATVRGTFSVHHARLFVEGVEISHPEVYNDGRYIIHGLRTFLQPLSPYSCFDRSHSRHCHDDSTPTTRPGDGTPTRSDATSVSVSATRVSVKIREAIARLRDGA